jgi:single-strand DNA-binding protein
LATLRLKFRLFGSVLYEQHLSFAFRALLRALLYLAQSEHSEGKKAVCAFGVATNHEAKSADGEKHEEMDYHRIVSFGKLAELCAEYLRKGRKIYIEGKLQSRAYTDNEGVQKASTEILLDDLVLLDGKPQETKSEITTLQGAQEQAATV